MTGTLDFDKKLNNALSWGALYYAREKIKIRSFDLIPGSQNLLLGGLLKIKTT